MSFRRFLSVGLLCCAWLFFACGCQSKEQTVDKPVAKQAVKKKVARNDIARPGETMPAEGSAQEPYVYSPAGRRDPFIALLEIKKAIPVDEGPLTPLQTFEVGQLRLAGVVVGHARPVAMVMVPGGKSYIVKKGDKVGKNHGTVIAINEQGVLVRERFYDFAGDIRENVQQIPLPKRSGVE